MPLKDFKIQDNFRRKVKEGHIVNANFMIRFLEVFSVCSGTKIFNGIRDKLSQFDVQLFYLTVYQGYLRVYINKSSGLLPFVSSNGVQEVELL